MIVKSKKNIVGPQVRMLRHRLGLKQKDLAARLQILGWDIESGSVSKIECQIVWIGDSQLLALAEVLGVSPMELLPKIDFRQMS